MKKFIALIILVFAVLGLLQVKSYMQNAAQAYLYGYPIVIMDETRKSMQAGYPETNKRVNHFTHIQVFPNHNFRNVVRPNVDTLYSIAWLDLSKEPVILSIPDTGDRYYVMPFMDAWTNVFASIGTREHGSKAGDYMLAGPNWAGEPADKLKLIKAPTNMIWVIGRFQTNGLEDIPSVAQLQNQFHLNNLTSWTSDIPQKNYTLLKPQKNSSIDPYAIVDELSSIEFLNTLTTLINSQGTPTQDKPALDNLTSLNLNLPIENNSQTTNPIKLWLLDKAFEITKKKVSERIADRSDNENGWMVKRSGIGRYGTNYPVRTAVAMIGLGALPPEEAVYPNASIDSENRTLSGKHKYKIHFPAGQLPPVDAFWSLTMYDENGFLIESTINRYAIGDRDQLEFNPDGSLDIFIQHEKPEKFTSNWLPAPKDNFAITLRLYLPKKEFLDGSWKLPPVVRVEN